MSEASGPPAPGTTTFDSQLGFAIRRWCAPALELDPSASAEDYLRRRAELGSSEVNRRLLTAAGVKTIVAYRFGFDFDPIRPGSADVAAAAGRLMRALETDPLARVDDQVLLRHLIWTAIDIGRPVQFHVGFGDTDVRMHRSNPTLLTEFLIATEPTGTPVMLLHCYPYHREA